jgi:hypothetical protein
VDIRHPLLLDRLAAAGLYVLLLAVGGSVVVLPLAVVLLQGGYMGGVGGTLLKLWLLVVPVVIWVGSVVWLVVRTRRGQPVWFVPLVAFGAAFAHWWGTFAVLFA